MLHIEPEIASRYPAGMDVRYNRKAKLTELVEKYGGKAELARRVDTAPAYISQLLNDVKRNVGHEFCRKVERMLGLPDGWMDTPPDNHRLPEALAKHLPGAQPAETRRVPVLDYVQAGHPREVVDAYAKGDGMDSVGVDPDMAAMLGPHAFALIVAGLSMTPDYNEGDVVIVDPDAPIRPGDIVVARVNGDEATVKKYRSRGNDASGNPVFELAPRNEDYPTILVNSGNPGELIGPVVEHRRRLRRPASK